MMISKAMILAAGFGTRLRPLTLHQPKPMVPLCNRPLLDYTLASLRRCGVQDVTINLHHLGQNIERYIEKNPPSGQTIRFSHEPQILDLGGGLKKAEALLNNGEPFLVHHGDVLSRIDLQPAIDCHLRRNALVTMVLLRPGPGRPQPTVEVAPDGAIRRIAGNPGGQPAGGEPAIFTGIHVLSPQIFGELPPVGTPYCLVRKGYPRLIAEGKRVLGVFAAGYWSDLGTPDHYRQANFDCLRDWDAVQEFYGFELPGRRIDSAGSTLIGENCRIENEVRLGPDLILGRGVCVRGSVQLTRSVVWDGATIERGLDREIVIH